MFGILTEFTRLLSYRFKMNVPTCEDCIRYTFFYVMTTQGKVQPHQVVLESPHPDIHRAQIDTIISDFAGKCWAIEFKYHRKAPSAGSATPHSQNAGEIFSDISRLAAYQCERETERLLIYVADSVMAGYFRNQRNGFIPLLDLQDGQRFSIDGAFIGKQCKTFQKTVGKKFEAEITCLFSAIVQGCELRVYNVLPHKRSVQ